MQQPDFREPETPSYDLAAPAVPALPPPPPPESPIQTATAEGSSPTARTVVGALADLYARQQALLENPLITWIAFKNAFAELQGAMLAARAHGDESVPRPGGNLENKATPTAFASAIGLLSTNDPRTIDNLLRDGLARPGFPNRGFLSALRLSIDLPLIERADFVAKESDGTVRVAVLAALADHRRLSVDRLLPLLEDPNELVAARAAEILAWIGRPPADRNAILRRLKKPGSATGLRCALLFAATALGSASALKDLRDFLDSGRQPASGLAIDALAVGGDRSDVARLLGLAARQGDLAPLAVLAAGHLGSVGAVDAIARMSVPNEIKDRAVQTILGDTANVPADQRRGRWLYGVPWTVVGALDRLQVDDELLRSRMWYALEAKVRTGVRVPVFIDLAAHLSVQERGVSAIRASLLPPRRWFSAGDWLFHGRRMG